MSIWTKRLFILLSIGGGYLEVVLMFQLFTEIKGQIAGYVLVSAMIATFAFGVFCGFKFIEDEQKGLRLLRWFFGIQIPILSSPIITYRLSAGAGINLSWIGSNMSFFWRFGSEMGVWILQDRPWGLGLNLFALAMFLWTGRLLKRKVANQISQLTPDGVADR
jgi:hypothetical protein